MTADWRPGHNRGLATLAAIATILGTVFAGIALLKNGEVGNVTNNFNTVSSDLKNVTVERDKLKTDNRQLRTQLAPATPTSSPTTRVNLTQGVGKVVVTGLV